MTHHNDTSTFRFAHYKLDAYHVARELADRVIDATTYVPAGHARLVDQIVRGATSVEALIAEGANRYTPKQKRQRYIEACGEAGEVAAHLERIHRYRFLTHMFTTRSARYTADGATLATSIERWNPMWTGSSDVVVGP